MEKWKEVFEEARHGKLNILEYLSRSEGPQLFSTALNDLLLQGAMPELPDSWQQLYSEITIQRRDINFPSIDGGTVDLVPELGEFKSNTIAFSSVTVTPQKFGRILPFSREMADDNEVDLLGWRTRELGRESREQRRREAFKCLASFSTGPAVASNIIGNTDHGFRYPQGGYSNLVSATGASWEEIIGRSIQRLASQTYTVGNQTVNFPVTPTHIVAHPHHMMAILKVLSPAITVVATGIGSQGNATNVAGSNIFKGVIQPIFDPTLVTAQAFVLAAKQGLVMVNRDPLTLETKEDYKFDVDDMKVRERYLPAVVRERFIADVQMSAA